MDARQLAYFLAVVQHQHFGRAAEQLHRAERRGAQLVEPTRQVLRGLGSAKAAAQSETAWT